MRTEIVVVSPVTDYRLLVLVLLLGVVLWQVLFRKLHF